jgi:type I site-specific restriction endonuclease
MWQLNLPACNFKIKNDNGKQYIFDSQRKKYISLTPEEWVRQNFIRFMIDFKSYPAALLAIEKQLTVNGLKKRCDAILYNKSAQPLMIIEFKAPQVSISQATFDQAAVYNQKLNVDFFMISNGMQHYCCKVDKHHSKYLFFEEIPDYFTLLNS